MLLPFCLLLLLFISSFLGYLAADSTAGGFKGGGAPFVVPFINHLFFVDTFNNPATSVLLTINRPFQRNSSKPVFIRVAAVFIVNELIQPVVVDLHPFRVQQSTRQQGGNIIIF
jgi:hypothetical protein